MPVIGHAFVGMATAMSVRPPRHAPRVAALWLPALVVFSYLPDIANQLVQVCGAGDARIATHSILFAVVASIVSAFVAARWCGVTWRRAFGLVLFSVLLHDALDLLQASDRAPLWPFSDHPVVFNRELIPTSVKREAVIFAGLFGMFLVLRWAWGRSDRAEAVEVRRDYLWMGRIGLAAILLAAGGTHLMRGVRQRELDRTEELLLAARFAEAIDAAEGAKRWPTAAKPGRAEYFQAQAYAGLGDLENAEAKYRVAVGRDYAYFWSIADYAVFIAGDPRRTAAQREREAGKLMARLRHDFASAPNLMSTLSKIQRRLAVTNSAPR